MTSTIRAVPLSQPTPCAINAPAETRSSQLNPQFYQFSPKSDLRSEGNGGKFQSLLTGCPKSSRVTLESGLFGKHLSTKARESRSNRAAFRVPSMAVSVGRPLESTVETNSTVYSVDEDPPDMPGLKKSNERFRLPHISDNFPDIIPKYSTFSTKSR